MCTTFAGLILVYVGGAVGEGYLEGILGLTEDGTPPPALNELLDPRHIGLLKGDSMSEICGRVCPTGTLLRCHSGTDVLLGPGSSPQTTVGTGRVLSSAARAAILTNNCCPFNIAD